MPNDTTRTQPVVWDLNPNRVLAFSGKHVQSRMDLREFDAQQLEYTRIMMAFLLHRARPACDRHGGLGRGSLPKFCHRHLPMPTLPSSRSTLMSLPRAMRLRFRLTVLAFVYTTRMQRISCSIAKPSSMSSW